MHAYIYALEYSPSALSRDRLARFIDGDVKGRPAGGARERGGGLQCLLLIQSFIRVRVVVTLGAGGVDIDGGLHVCVHGKEIYFIIDGVEGGRCACMKVEVGEPGASSMGKQDQDVLQAQGEEGPCMDIVIRASTVPGSVNPKSTTPSKRFKRICVFCGSSCGKKDIFSIVAFSLGRELVSRKIDLVYGGGGNGLMGQVAQTVHDGGGHVVGVIPKALIGHEISGQTIGKLVAVSDMHQRKAEMARQADAFIALPGGYGTLEELLEVITWSQLGIHEKPVGLLNVDGYYNPLLTLFDKALEEGFLKFSARSIVVSARTPSELLDKLEAYTPIQDRSIPKLCWEDAERLAYAGPTVSSTAQ